MSELNAVLVRFTLKGQWTARAVDEAITKDVHERTESSDDSGKYTKVLFPESSCGKDNSHKKWMQACGALRSYHYEHTLVWETPFRILKADQQAAYDAKVNELADVAREASEQFYHDYEDLKRLARDGLKGSWNEEDYPSVDSIASKFLFTVGYTPVPQASHFVTGLVGPAIEAARQRIEEQNAVRIQQAVTETWKRVIAPVAHLAEVLADDKPVIRESLLGNVIEVAELIPTLNLTEDAELSAAKQQLIDLTEGLSKDDLKDDPVLRKDTARKAIDVVQSFGVLGKRKVIS